MAENNTADFFVAIGHHKDCFCGKYCVWDPERTFLCACNTQKDAKEIAMVLNKHKQINCFDELEVEEAENSKKGAFLSLCMSSNLGRW